MKPKTGRNVSDNVMLTTMATQNDWRIPVDGTIR